MFAQGVEMDFWEALLRQADVIGAGAQKGQGVGRILGHALRISVHKLTQFSRAIGADPARAGILTAF